MTPASTSDTSRIQNASVHRRHTYSRRKRQEWPKMTISELRGQIHSLIHEFGNAHRRQLFDEISLFQYNYSVAYNHLNSNLNELIQDEMKVGLNKSKVFNNDKKKNCKAYDKSVCVEKEAFDTKGNTRRTWGAILNDLSHLLPHMSAQEHGLVCRLTSVCLLSYLIPHATPFPTLDCGDGKDASSFMNRNARKNHTQSKSDSFLLRNPIVDHDNNGSFLLEEILEHSIRVYDMSSIQYDPAAIQHETIVASLWHFLRKGLRPFLASRPLSPYPYAKNISRSGATDLLHVMAMAVAPDIPKQLRYSSLVREESDDFAVRSPYQTRAERFMSCLQPLYFQISYSYRAEIVHVLAESLVLSGTNVQHLEQQHVRSINDGINLDPLINSRNEFLYGGIVHLRTAVKTFALSALSHYQFIDAQKVLVNIAIDSGEERFVKEEVNSMITLLTQECTERKDAMRCCRKMHKTPRKQERVVHMRRFVVPNLLNNSTTSSTLLQQLTRQQESKDSLCFPCEIGDLLRDLIIRHNGSRYYADGFFTRQALSVLSKAVASILSNNDAPADKVRIKLSVSCQVASVLDCARTIFYFLLNVRAHNKATGEEETGSLNETKKYTKGSIRGNEPDKQQKLEEEMKDSVIGYAIQLLTSQDRCVSTSASSLLSLAFAYDNKYHVSLYLSKVFSSIKLALSGVHIYKGQFQDVVVVVSRLSYAFATSFLSLLLILITKKDNLVKMRRESVLCLISSVALAQPRVVLAQLDDLKAIHARCNSDRGITRHIIAIVLSCRLAQNFPDEKGAIQCCQYATDLLSSVTDPWSVFELGRHAFCTSNYGIAHLIFDRLQCMCSSSGTFLWFSTLSKVAQAEHILMEEGALGIPTALPMFDSAINNMRALSTFTLSEEAEPSLAPTIFQIDILCRRKDFLNLCLIVRGLCAEMRLIDSSTKRTIRTHLHQTNISNCFQMLASQYVKINKQFGIIQCQQTRTSLRSLFALSRFIGMASQKAFCETSRRSSHLHNLDTNNQVVWPSGDICHPLYKVLKKLEKNIIEPINEAIDPKVRAEALLQIIDAVMRSPIPFAKGFLSLQTFPLAQLRISVKTDEIEEVNLPVDTEVPNSVAGEAEVIELQVGIPCTLQLSGFLPNQYFKKSDLPFSEVITWHTVSYDGPLVGDDEGEGQQPINAISEEGNANGQNDASSVTSSSQFLPAGKYLGMNGRELAGAKFLSTVKCAPIRREGYYKVEVTLGVRDVRCGEYEIPMEEDSGVIFLCISA